MTIVTSRFDRALENKMTSYDGLSIFGSALQLQHLTRDQRNVHCDLMVFRLFWIYNKEGRKCFI